MGQGVDGRFQGMELNILPGFQTTWERCVSAHPDTRILDKKGAYRSDTYGRYYADCRPGILGQKHGDLRLYAKDLVVGVNINGRAKAYHFDELGLTPVLNDVVNWVSLVVIFDDDSDTGVVFSPTVDGKHLNVRELQASGEFLTEDLETESVWEPLTWVAWEGPLAGARLEQVASHYEFWFCVEGLSSVDGTVSERRDGEYFSLSTDIRTLGIMQSLG
jgi:hypothetical protein